MPKTPAQALLAPVDLHGSLDVLFALRPHLPTWTTPEQLPAVLDLLARTCNDAGIPLFRDYAAYVTRLDRDARVEGRTVAEWIEGACGQNPKLAQLLDVRR